MDEFIDSENRSMFPVVIGWLLIGIAIVLAILHVLTQVSPEKSHAASDFHHIAAYPLRAGAMIIGAIGIAVFFLAARRFTNRFTTSLNVLAVVLLLAGLGVAVVSVTKWQARLHPGAQYAAVANKFQAVAGEQFVGAQEGGSQKSISRFESDGFSVLPRYSRTWNLPQGATAATCQSLPERLGNYGTVTKQPDAAGYDCVYAVQLHFEPSAAVVAYVGKQQLVVSVVATQT